MHVLLRYSTNGLFVIMLFIFVVLIPSCKNNQVWESSLGSGGLAYQVADARIILMGNQPGLLTSGGTVRPDHDWKVSNRGDTYQFEKAGEWTITQKISEPEGHPGWMKISTRVMNLSSGKVAIESIIPLEPTEIVSLLNLPEFLKEGQLTWTYSGFIGPAEETSYSLAGLTDKLGEMAFVIGFSDLSDAVYSIDVVMGSSSVESLRARCNREGIELGPGEELVISDLVMKSGRSLNGLLKEYGGIVAENMGSSAKEPPVGWCSWYYYYKDFHHSDMMENMKALEETGLDEVVDLIQIDAGWYLPEEGSPRIRGDFLNDSTPYFPGGMKKAAGDIKSKGYTAGIWLAPFMGDPDSRLYKEHPEYFVHNEKDQTIKLDLSHPATLEHLRRVFQKLVDDGFDYFKIDFLGTGIGEGQRHDMTETSVVHYRKALRMIREVLGEDRFLLACGAPLGPSIGLVDGMRVGHDIAPRWMIPESITEENILGTHGIKVAANQVIRRQWMNGLFWANDPDCIITRDYGNTLVGALSQSKEQPGMEYEEASLWSQVVWFTGGMGLLGENVGKLKELSPERFRMMTSAIPVNAVSPEVVDWYMDPEVSILKSDGEPLMFGIFNLTDKEYAPEVLAMRLGIEGDWSFKERESGETFGGSGDMVSFPPMPPHSARIWIKE